MHQTKMGLYEMPREGTAYLSAEDLDLIIVPGLAFTLEGDRIGYGGGYYDRLFARIPNTTRLAPSYDSFILESLPVDEHDMKVNILISESLTAFLSHS